MTAKSSHRILLAGNAVGDTGYAVVLREMGDILSRRHQVWLYGLDFKGPRHREERMTIIPNPEPMDRTGARGLMAAIKETVPDILLFCHDPWLWAPLRKPLRELKRAPATVFYCPVDSPWSPLPRADLHGLDAVVAYTGFGSLELQKAGFPVRDVIPHGLTAGASGNGITSVERELARALLWPDRPELWDSFMVLNANRNNLRKRLDLTLEGFASFAALTGANAWLVLHTAPVRNGCNLLGQAAALGIADRVIFTGEGERHPFFPRERLSLLYRACDVGVNTSTGEGWGLIAFEHAAAGRAQVLADHTSHTELWKGAALLISADKGEGREDHPAANGRIDSRELAAALAALYNDPSFLGEMSERCRKRATEPAFDWETICEEWETLFRQLLSERRNRLGKPMNFSAEKAAPLSPAVPVL